MKLQYIVPTWDNIDLKYDEIEYLWNGCVILHDTYLLQWDNSDLVWNTDIYTWGDCVLIREIVDALRVGGIPEEVVYDRYKDNHHFVKLVCKVKGEKYEKTKVFKNIQIFISDVKLVAKSVLNVDVKIDL